VRLTILGSGGGWPRPHRAASGYLLQQDGFNLWLDAGTGTMAELQEHIELLDVHAVLVSHRHFDHFLDVYPYFLSIWYHQDRTGTVPFYAPPGMFEHAVQLEESLSDVFESRPVALRDQLEIGPFRITTAPMAHPVPTLGMRFSVDGFSMSYTADTGPSEEMVNLVRGSDLLLSEATWIERPSTAPIDLHMTASEAGEHAHRAEVGRLMITHIWPASDPDLARQDADATYRDGPVELAEPGASVEL
jgi:ribonuclease BN (tRNA processing enzyme)